MAPPPKKGAKGGRGKPGGKAPPKQGKQSDGRNEIQVPPQERVDTVRPFWETLGLTERKALLSIDVEALRARARQADAAKQAQAPAAAADSAEADELAEPTLEEVLDEGVRRLGERGTWKLWSWMAECEEFYDAEAFRNFVTERHIRDELRKLLPRDDPKSAETAAEAAFRTRMTALLQRVQQNERPAGEDEGGKGGEKGEGGGGKKEKGEGGGKKERGEGKEGGKRDREDGKDGKGGTDGGGRYRRRRDVTDTVQTAVAANVELISAMLQAMESEQECIYQAVLQPIAGYVMEVLPEGARETTKSELAFEDLEKLQLDDAANIVEWLTEKIDALSTKLKADPKDEQDDDDENMGDVDLWSIVGGEEGGDGSGRAVCVNDKWLTHLTARLLGEDGHPRKARDGEDRTGAGLVLEWVYGLIVSTAEKARDGAKRCLGSYMPCAADAHAMLLRALEDCFIWDTRTRQAKEMMADMLKAQIEASALAKLHDTRAVVAPAPPPPTASDAAVAAAVAAAAEGIAAAAAIVEDLPALPNHVVVSMLRREVLLTKAKLHHLVFLHLQQDATVRTLKAQLRQGEPEFERLKRELDEVKHAHRGLDGTYRSAAEMERHRAQLADAAIEEQLEVQTAFRELGARLQATYDKKQRAEYEMAKRETEIKQLQGWKGTVENLVDKFIEVLSCAKGGLEAALAPRDASPAAPTPASPTAVITSTATGTEDAAPADAADSADAPAPPGDVESGAGPEAAAAAAAAATTSDDAGGLPGVAGEDAPTSPAAHDVWEEMRGLDLTQTQCMQLAKLRTHFHKDVRKQLYGDTEHQMFFDWLKSEVKVIDKRLEELRVALQHLEMHLLNCACDDPGATIGMQLALPLLQERLDARALEYAAVRAKSAEAEILAMEMEQAAREAAERERRNKAKQSKKDKVRTEKEKAAAEQREREAAAQAAAAAAAEERRQRDDAERDARLRAAAEARREEEERMERRRQELLSDENGYWRRRMEAEAKSAEAAAVRDYDSPEDTATASSHAPANDDNGAAAASTPERFDNGSGDASASAAFVATKRGSKARGAAGPRGRDGAPAEGGAAAGGGPHAGVGGASAGGPGGGGGAKAAGGAGGTRQADTAQHRRGDQGGHGVRAGGTPQPAAAAQATQQQRPAAAAPAAAVPVGGKPAAELAPVAVATASSGTVAVPEAPPTPPQASATPAGSSAGTPPPRSPPAASAPPAAAAAAAPTPAAAVAAVTAAAPAAAAAASTTARVPEVGASAAAAAGAQAGAGPGSASIPESSAPGSPLSGHTGAGGGGGPLPMMGGPPGPPPGGLPLPPLGMVASGPPGMGPPQMPHPGMMGMGAMPPHAHPGMGGPVPNGPLGMGPNGPMMGSPGGPMMGPMRPGMQHGPGAMQVGQMGGPSGHMRPMGGPGMGPGGPHPGMGPMPPMGMAMGMQGPYPGHPSMGPNGPNGPHGMMPNDHMGQHMGYPMYMGPNGPVHYPMGPNGQGMMHLGQGGSMGGPMGPGHLNGSMPQHMGGGQQHMGQAGGMQHPHHMAQQQQMQQQTQQQGRGPGGSPGGDGRGKASLSVGAKPFVPSFGSPSHAAVAVVPPPPAAAVQQAASSEQITHESTAAVAQTQQQVGPPGPAEAGSSSGGAPAAPPLASSSSSGGQGNGGKPAARDTAGCSPTSPLAVLDGADTSDGSAVTDVGDDAPAAAAGLRPPGPPAAAAAGQPQQAQHQQPGRSASGGELSASGGAATAAQAAERQSLGKPPSWSSALSAAAAGGDSDGGAAARAQQQPSGPGSSAGPSPMGSAGNLAALASAGGGGGALSFKQKLQANLSTAVQAQQQQQAQAQAQQQPGGGGKQPKAAGGRTSPPPPPPPPPPLRPTGSSTSAAAMAEPAKPPPGSLVKLPAGRVGYVPPTASKQQQPPPASGGDGASASGTGSAAAGAAAKAQVVTLNARGLLNRGAQNNCFLNVIVQALWHLSAFRAPMLALPLSAVTAKAGGSAKDAAVLAALWRIFQAMGSPEGSKGESDIAISPVELRAALNQQSAVRIDSSDMQDANEVLNELLGILHRAELGQPANKATDLGLPRNMRLPVGAPPTAPLPTAAPASLAHAVFGIDVQQPCAPGGGDGDDGRKGGSSGARQQRRGASPTAPDRPGSGASTGGVSAAPCVSGVVGAEPASPPRWRADPAQAQHAPGAVVEVQQFTKFAHLITAQDVRRARSRAPAAFFEELLAGVEAPEPRPADARGAPPGAAVASGTTLLRAPAVFTLALVWESPQAPKDAIRGTVEALGDELLLPLVFPTGPSAAAGGGCGVRHRVRSVVCYFGHHYQVFALNAQTGLWLLFDDEDVQLVGQWADVCRAMVAKRLQPSLLFYEATGTTA
ncbi:hypothetical protein FOA52_005590 [Chlamydomonas sp. UWO 241]|nr:hypothetical protein FOA52_005590 [Chlamydomonas sp. UWO 241]